MSPRKPVKPREKTIAENYFPVNEEDLKKTTEKIIKNPLKEEITKRAIEIPIKKRVIEEQLVKRAVEKPYDKPEKKEIVEKIPGKRIPKKNLIKKEKKTSKAYSIPEISLKKSGYELIITEKPQAAMKIAAALGNPRKLSNEGIPYYEINRNGKEIIVACAAGHLFTLSQNNPTNEIPIFDISWKPNFLVRKKDFTKKYYDTLFKLAKGAGSLTVATDFDIEGELIGLNIIRLIAGQKDANRMKFSTLTNSELNEAYENKMPTLWWSQAIAGETRHFLDWFYGINLSRALMNAIKSVGKFKIISIGRVQGPTLNLIVQKEKEIAAFKPEPYWQVFITIKDQNSTNRLELKYIKDIFDEKELKKFEDLKGKTAITETTKTRQVLAPQPPFDLTTLQTEAYRFYGINPARTLQIAQSLYLSGLISYPRTSSQKLPPSINYKEILKKLAKQYNVEKLITKTKPLEGRKTDPAHPSIYPTGNTQILAGEEGKIYNLIARRFLSLFCDDAILENKTITAKVDDLIFLLKGSAIKKKSWLEIYPSKLKEVEIPDVNGKQKIIDSRIEEKQTQPPKRYSQASIISQLEKKNLGTKATRSSILETLYDRGYVQGKSIEATPLGISLITTLEKYSPIIIDEKLTRKFEQEMNSIIEAKKDLEKKKEKVISEAKKTITEISKDFEKNQLKIGEELVQANQDYRNQQRIENTLIQCPKCKKGNLAITYSKKNRRFFVACDAYPECKTTFSLPPNGIIKKTEKICEECGFPILIRLSKGKRPWEFCFNPECKTNKKRLEEQRNKSEE